MEKLLIIVLTASLVSYTGALGEYSSHSCGDTIVIQCPQAADPIGASYILIDESTFGSYHNSSCVGSCCNPDRDNDCEMPVSEVQPGDYDKIIDQCNMTETTCSIESTTVENIGAKCPPPGISNFQVIYFTCVFADGNPPTTTTTTTTTTTSPETSESTSTLPTQPATTDKPDDNGGTNIGAIIGGVLGGICAIAIIIMIVLLCLRRNEFIKVKRSHPPRPVHIRNSGIPKGEVVVYDNQAYDEEMIMGNGKTVKAVSSRPNSVHYENANVSMNSQLNKPASRDSIANGSMSSQLNTPASRDSIANASMNSQLNKPASRDSIASSTHNHYDYVETKPKQNVDNQSPTKKQDAAKGEDVGNKALSKKEVEKNSDATPSNEITSKKVKEELENSLSSNKNEAPVVENSAPKLGKAASAIDVSSTQKLDKSAAYKHSAPCLTGELTTTAESEKNEDDEKGPNKEIF